MNHQEASKKCPSCNEVKGENRFKFSRGKPTGRCYDCLNVVLRKRYQDPAERDRARNRQMKSQYGLELDHYELFTRAVGGKCQICKGVNADGSRLCVDHDHNCCPGKKSCGNCIRGLLCKRCNNALGLFNDDVDALRSAVNYLIFAGAEMELSANGA